jgi:hypothetical protein
MRVAVSQIPSPFITHAMFGNTSYATLGVRTACAIYPDTDKGA